MTFLYQKIEREDKMTLFILRKLSVIQQKRQYTPMIVIFTFKNMTSDCHCNLIQIIVSKLDFKTISHHKWRKLLLSIVQTECYAFDIFP